MPLIMQSSVSIRRERTSSEVDEVLQARHRRQTSANLGKKHFNLAPGLISSPSTSASPHEGPSHRSSTDAWHHYKRYTSRLSTASSYDDAWSRHHGFHQSRAPSTIFEQVPRATSRPIMSRLPLRSDERDAIAADPTRAGNLDYLNVSIQGGDAVPGSHSDSVTAQEVTYTRARLPEMDEETEHLWQALHGLQNLSDEYADGYGAQARQRKQVAPHPVSADMDVEDCPAFASTASSASQNALALVRRIFNWDQLPDLPIEDENVWYGVAFRSKRKVGSESVSLYEADRRSHEEAVNSGGLLMYWYGLPNAQTGHNLATCVWTNRQDALRASSLPLHARAAAHSLKAYESFELHRYALRKVRGESKLRVEEWLE